MEEQNQDKTIEDIDNKIKNSFKQRKTSIIENLTGILVCSTIPATIDYANHIISNQNFNPFSAASWYYLAFGSSCYDYAWGHNNVGLIGYIASTSPELFNIGAQVVEKGLNFNLINYQDDAKNMLYKAILFGLGAFMGKMFDTYNTTKKTTKTMEELGEKMGKTFKTKTEYLPDSQ